MKIFRKNTIKKVAISHVATIILFSTCFGGPQMNKVDPLPNHTIFGIDPYPPATEGREKGHWVGSFHVSPYYQDAPGSRNAAGDKVAIGAEYGAWNTAGIFYGVSKAVDDSYEANVLPDLTWTGSKPAASGENYEKFKAALELLDTKYTDTTDTNFDPANVNHGTHTVDVSYQRLGVRGEIRIALFEGADLTVRAGACEYRMTPTIFTPHADADDDVKKYLLEEFKLDEIMSELGLSLDRVHDVVLEDTYVRLSGGFPLLLKDENDNDVVTFAPSVAVGVWLPTGKKVDHDKAFSISSGNDGHTGVCVEGAINLDFHETILASAGGGLTYFNDKTYDNFRTPNHMFQNGIYPWRTKIKRDPGYSWFAHASMRALRFMNETSFYLDYSYSAHQADTITCEDSSAARAALFTDGTKLLQERSVWNCQELHCGIMYEASPNLEMGLSFHAHVGGQITYRTKTITGSVRFLF
ncbi:hypothetical protein ACFLY6_02620 [Candidatus Dependentiae bacterium]